jgi:hypothetical protein
MFSIYRDFNKIDLIFKCIVILTKTMNNQQHEILLPMFEEVRIKLRDIATDFYDNQGINLQNVDINNELFMDDLVEIAFDEYSNSNNYSIDFEGMHLWDNMGDDSVRAFGVVLNYITISMRVRLGNTYNIPIDNFININSVKSLFQYVYLTDNMNVIRQILIDVYNENRIQLQVVMS